MKRFFTCFVITILSIVISASCLASGFGGIFAETSALPDPAVLLECNPVLYGNDIIADGVAYYGYSFPKPDDHDRFIAEYALLAEEAGYTVTEVMIGTIEDHSNIPAWQISTGMLNAYIIPDYRGCMLLLINPMMDSALLPTPTPTPSPTPKPTPRPTARPASDDSAYPGSTTSHQSSGGHLEYREVKQDCFACVGGVCDLCNGSGIYRMYGSEIPCSIWCETCGGLGYWYTTEAIWVP